MSGAWRIWPRAAAPVPRRHDHIDILLRQHVVRLTDPRRFGALLWHPESEVLWPRTLCWRARASNLLTAFRRRHVAPAIEKSRGRHQTGAACGRHRRGCRQYLRIRSAVSRGHRPEDAGASPRCGCAANGWPLPFATCYLKRSSWVAARCATSCRPPATRAISCSMRRSTSGRASHAGCAHADPPHRPGPAFDLLVPAMPAALTHADWRCSKRFAPDVGTFSCHGDDRATKGL